MKRLKAAGRQGGGLAEDSRSPIISEGSGSVEQFERIDWAAAAPSWASIIGGVALPVLAVVGLIFLIDVSLCWMFEQWIDHLWTVPIWLLAAMILPFALAGAIALAKLFNKHWIEPKHHRDGPSVRVR